MPRSYACISRVGSRSFEGDWYVLEILLEINISKSIVWLALWSYYTKQVCRCINLSLYFFRYRKGGALFELSKHITEHVSQISRFKNKKSLSFPYVWYRSFNLTSAFYSEYFVVVTRKWHMNILAFIWLNLRYSGISHSLTYLLKIACEIDQYVVIWFLP